MKPQHEHAVAGGKLHRQTGTTKMSRWLSPSLVAAPAPCSFVCPGATLCRGRGAMGGGA